jgi:hypothetical protein
MTAQFWFGALAGGSFLFAIYSFRNAIIGWRQARHQADLERIDREWGMLDGDGEDDDG